MAPLCVRGGSLAFGFAVVFATRLVDECYPDARTAGYHILVIRSTRLKLYNNRSHLNRHLRVAIEDVAIHMKRRQLARLFTSS